MQSQRKYFFFGLFTLLVCSVAIYIHRHQHGKTRTLDRLLIGLQGGAQKNFFYLGNGIRTVFDNYFWLVDTKKKNEALEKELYYLRTKLAVLQEVEFENLRLRHALKFKENVEPNLLSAHVIAHDVSPDYSGIRIDRGTADGVVVGMGVLSPSGLLGRVHRVASQYSDVIALVDPASNIDAVIQRSRVRGIVTGQSKQLTCKMRYIDRLDDVVVNDTVVASGFMGIFPKGLLIGYVTAVIPSANAVLQTIMLKAAVDIYRVEEVFIVLASESTTKVVH